MAGVVSKASLVLVFVACIPGCGGNREGSSRPKDERGHASVEQTQSGLSCDIFLPRRQFAPCGIPIYFLLTNTGLSAVSLDGRIDVGTQLVLEIRTPDGTLIHWPSATGTLVLPRRDDFQVIRPGFVYGRTIVLPGDDLSIEHSVGSYSVVAHFAAWETGKEFGLRAWTGSLRSQEVQFEIVPYGQPLAD